MSQVIERESSQLEIVSREEIVKYGDRIKQNIFDFLRERTTGFALPKTFDLPAPDPSLNFHYARTTNAYESDSLFVDYETYATHGESLGKNFKTCGFVFYDKEIIDRRGSLESGAYLTVTYYDNGEFEITASLMVKNKSVDIRSWKASSVEEMRNRLANPVTQGALTRVGVNSEIFDYYPPQL